MLIKCPECGREISDKCGNCSHCGFPIEVQEILYEYEGKEYNIKPIVDSINSENSYIKTSNIIFNILNKRFDATDMYDDIIRKYCPDMIEKCFSYSQVDEAKEDNVPHCPTCQSTNIKKISGTERVASVAMMGIFSKKINKTYKCLNCKYTW